MFALSLLVFFLLLIQGVVFVSSSGPLKVMILEIWIFFVNIKMNTFGKVTQIYVKILFGALAAKNKYQLCSTSVFLPAEVI